MADTLAGQLATIRLDQQKATGFPMNGEQAAVLCRHVPALLRVVDRLLELHGPGQAVVLGSTCDRHEAHRHFSITGKEAADVRACPDCSAVVYTSCTGCGGHVSVERCHVRVAIIGALAGEDGGDARDHR